MWFQALAALLADFEFEYLQFLSDPVRTLETMLLVKLLSTHSQDEFYLSGPQTEWITVRRLCASPEPSPPIAL